jgi:hypothetical protein
MIVHISDETAGAWAGYISVEKTAKVGYVAMWGS